MTPPPPAPSVRFGHVFIVVEENANFGDVIANPALPYLNGLANQYGLAANYFANAHPSIPNYFKLTTGQILTLIDASTPSDFPVSSENVVRDLLAAGKSWKSYAEDIPSVGYTGGDTGRYAVRHNPLAYFTDVQNDPTQLQNLVPFSQFAVDRNAAKPRFSSLSRICVMTRTTARSAQLIPGSGPTLTRSYSPQFRMTACLYCLTKPIRSTSHPAAANVAAVIISPLPSVAKSIAFYQHQSVSPYARRPRRDSLPDAATAPAMWEFFGHREQRSIGHHSIKRKQDMRSMRRSATNRQSGA
jgi:acid phosphatase